MDWHQSKLSYYLDFALVPILMIVAFFMTPLSSVSAGLAAIGFAAWTLVEYWMHRVVFHRCMRRAHWTHHVRPRSYIAAPAWITLPIHAAIFATYWAADLLSFYIGFEAGYLGYICVHDRIHHCDRAKLLRGWLQHRYRLHMMHHRGLEANFGVITSFWDWAHGTLIIPRTRT